MIRKGFSKSPSKNKCPRFLIHEPGQDSTENLEQGEAIHWSPLGGYKEHLKSNEFSLRLSTLYSTSKFKEHFYNFVCNSHNPIGISYTHFTKTKFRLRV